jgi:transaldolase
VRLYLDSADRTALTPLLGTGLFGGVTTNPLILQRAGVRLADVPALVEWILGRCSGEVFVQTTLDGVDEIVHEGRDLRRLSERLVVKIPASTAGLTAARRLADEGAPVLLTAVYHARQALLADAAGAAWIAPYLGRMDAAGRNGREQILQMQTLLRGTGTRVLVASIKDAEQVTDLAARGVDAFTVGPEVAEQLLEEPLTEAAVAEFARATISLT